MKKYLAPVLLALILSSAACATTAPIVTATNAEHIAVTSVHAVVQAEAQAFMAGAYDSAHHQTYVSALLKVTQAEKTLNDALHVWNAASGQPMPAVVAIAIANLSTILSDVTPLVPANSAVAPLVTSITTAIRQLSGGAA